MLGRSAAAVPLSAEPITSVPAGEMLKMGGEVVGRVRVQSGIFGDVSVAGFPIADPGAWFGLAEVDSFVDPVA